MYINLNNINLCVWPRKVGKMYGFYAYHLPVFHSQPCELPWNIHEKLKGARGIFGVYYKSEAEALEDYWQACISI